MCKMFWKKNSPCQESDAESSRTSARSWGPRPPTVPRDRESPGGVRFPGRQEGAGKLETVRTGCQELAGTSEPDACP